MSARILLLLGPSTWEGPVVAGLTHPASRVEITRRCVDTADLLASSESGLAEIAVIGFDTPRLDSEVISRVLQSGLRLVGLVKSGDEDAASLMTQWGAHAVVEMDQQELGRSLTEVISAIHHLVERVPAGVEATNDARSDSPLATGRVICVWGPPGAPGRTSLAIGIADECANLGFNTILIDADTWAPSIALTLGLADDGVGLASACRRALTGALDQRSLQSILRPISDHLCVLTGTGRADRWTEVRRSAMLAVVQRARAQADVVVIDCAAPLESDEELVFDTSAPRRNAATFVALEQAADVVVVGAADPVGLVRLVNGLTELRELQLPGRIHVVANRVRESMLGRHPNEAVTDVLGRHAGLTEVWCIPQDSVSMDHALRQGCTLRELGDDSAVRVAIRALAQAIAATERNVKASA